MDDLYDVSMITSAYRSERHAAIPRFTVEIASPFIFIGGSLVRAVLFAIAPIIHATQVVIASFAAVLSYDT